MPKKFFTAKKADTGKAIIVDIINATIDTFKERSIISYRSSSNEKLGSMIDIIYPQKVNRALPK